MVKITAQAHFTKLSQIVEAAMWEKKTSRQLKLRDIASKKQQDIKTREKILWLKLTDTADNAV
jgi:hypothetical protein